VIEALLRLGKENNNQNVRQVKLLDRFKLSIVSTLGYWIIRIVGSSLRWEKVDWSDLESIHKKGKQAIIAFWHGRIFLGTFAFRHRGIVVMTSQNRDGDYIARVIERFGFGAARGSSTRGSRGAILEMLRQLEQKRDVAFTIDGPLGPRYVAKPGAAYLAWKSGNAVLPFSVAVEKKWVMRSWDHFVVPKPFSRAMLIFGAPIYVAPEAKEEELKMAESAIQHSLDELRQRTDTHWGGEADQ
jgi:lysophospholipid acyltransferase (LPLAT)-like uncharacterized protein